MPDLEAIEVAQSDLSDVNDSEPSEALKRRSRLNSLTWKTKTTPLMLAKARTKAKAKLGKSRNPNAADVCGVSVNRKRTAG